MAMREIRIQVTEAEYSAAVARAKSEGWADAEEYAASLVRAEIGDADSFEHIFTPEYLEKLEAISAEMDLRGGLTPEEVDQRLEETKKAWRAKNSA
jgi:hypothetical protein